MTDLCSTVGVRRHAPASGLHTKVNAGEDRKTRDTEIALMAKLKTRFGQFVQWFKANQSSSKKTSKSDHGSPIAAAVIDESAEITTRKPAKESPMQQLQKGYDEIIDLMGSVRNHMELQSERSERLLNVLEGLPEALKSLPEASRNQTRTLDAIQANLEQQGQHNGKLSEALNGLTTTTKQHQHAMTAVGKQLDAGHQRSEQMLQSFNSLSGTLDRMSDSNEASTGLLRLIAEQESKAAEQVRELFTRNQKHMTTMSVVSWSLALVALTVAGYVAVSVTRLASQPLSATPTPAANNESPVVNPDSPPTNVVPASATASTAASTTANSTKGKTIAPASNVADETIDEAASTPSVPSASTPIESATDSDSTPAANEDDSASTDLTSDAPGTESVSSDSNAADSSSADSSDTEIENLVDAGKRPDLDPTLP